MNATSNTRQAGLPEWFWHDFDSLTTTVNGVRVEIEVYDQPGPGRKPAGSTLLGRTLYVRVVEATGRLS